MKKIVFLLLFIPAIAAAQHSATSYQYRKASQYGELGVGKSDIVFLGSDITDNVELAELFGNRRVVNRGIRGETTGDMLARLERIADGRPRKIFVAAGTDDLHDNNGPKRVTENVMQMIRLVKNESPRTQIYFISIPPVNGNKGKMKGAKQLSQNIITANAGIKSVCSASGCTFIDVYSALAGDNGALRQEYTDDGLHLTGAGYLAWRDIIKKHLK